MAQLAVDAADAAAAVRKTADIADAALAAALAARDACVAGIDACIEDLANLAAGPLPPPEGPDPADAIRSTLATARGRLVELEGAIVNAREAAVATAERAAAKDAAAAAADDVAAAAMAAAEAAVRDEMEAAAVAKETRSALAKAMADLVELGVAFADGDVAADARAKEKSAKKAAADAAAAKKEDVASPAAAAAAPAAAAASPATAAPVVGDAAAAAAAPAVPKAAAAAAPPDGPPLDAPPAGLASTLARLRARRVLAAAAALAAITAALLTMRSAGVGEGEGARAWLAAAAAPASAAARAAASTALALLPPVPHGTEGLLETIWLLATSVVAVPLVSRLPGGSPVLGFLVGGAAIGPHALGIIQGVASIRHLAELGVVFLLFNIGLELSLERLASMQKYVFGLGTTQVVATLAACAGILMALGGFGGPAAVVLGGGLALSSTAVAMQVLQDRGESGSRHGRATFAVLLLQDLAVVVLLMLIPLLAPTPDGGSAGAAAISRALGVAAVKAVTCIAVIMAGGRAIVRPIYRRIADAGNADVFAATTLLTVLGTSVLTQVAGLSLALGAFLAGLLLAETEFALQVESDIAPYKGLLMGLFFMTVGMEISPALFFARYKSVIGGIAALLIGKTAIVAAIGPLFGLSMVTAVRSGLLLASGGEFAFVAFGEAVAAQILDPAVVAELFLVVALTMALTPLLAELGARFGKAFDRSDMKALQPPAAGGEAAALRGHVIIAGFGRVGQIIAQLLAERLIPFVAVDVRVDRVRAGKELDLPVYFGDAGSPAVLHALGAERAACAVITLDTPGANYRSVWALNKHYPSVRTYVRAHDVDHGLNLERAGATAVVPETLEPSLQLASAVLAELKLPPEEVAAAVSAFRRTHLAELQALAAAPEGGMPAGGRMSLGYGYTTVDDDNEEGVGVGGDVDALPAAA